MRDRMVHSSCSKEVGGGGRRWEIGERTVRKKSRVAISSLSSRFIIGSHLFFLFYIYELNELLLPLYTISFDAAFVQEGCCRVIIFLVEKLEKFYRLCLSDNEICYFQHVCNKNPLLISKSQSKRLFI